MPNQLPVTADFGALPATAQGYTPQEFADRMSQNFRLFTAQSFALFVTGATAPTSDVGPWAKNGNSWYYWDSVSGTYIPFVIEQASLGYWIGDVAPDETVYQFWIQTNGAGSPLALKIYYSGAWVDVYAATLATYATTTAMNAAIAAALTSYSTTAQMNAAIAAALTSYSTTAQMNAAIAAALTAYSTTTAMNAAIAAAIAPYLTSATAAVTYQTQAAMANYSTTSQMNTAIANDPKYEFRAYKNSAPQNYTAGSGEVQITLDAEDFDTNNAFASNVFTAPVAGRYHFTAAMFIGIDTGSPTGIERTLILRKNGSAVSWWKEQSTDDTDGLTAAVNDTINLAANDTVDIAVQVVSTGASTWNITNTSLDTFLTGFLVKKN